jgi:hypothetical protein
VGRDNLKRLLPLDDVVFVSTKNCFIYEQKTFQFPGGFDVSLGEGKVAGDDNY